jgi:hypothetical protein
MLKLLLSFCDEAIAMRLAGLAYPAAKSIGTTALPEQGSINRFREYIALNRFDKVGAGFTSISLGLIR